MCIILVLGISIVNINSVTNNLQTLYNDFVHAPGRKSSTFDKSFQNFEWFVVLLDDTIYFAPGNVKTPIRTVINLANDPESHG